MECNILNKYCYNKIFRGGLHRRVCVERINNCFAEPNIKTEPNPFMILKKTMLYSFQVCSFMYEK